MERCTEQKTQHNVCIAHVRGRTWVRKLKFSSLMLRVIAAGKLDSFMWYKSRLDQCIVYYGRCGNKAGFKCLLTFVSVPKIRVNDELSQGAECILSFCRIWPLPTSECVFGGWLTHEKWGKGIEFVSNGDSALDQQAITDARYQKRSFHCRWFLW